jgi:general secretion pathway protein G
MKVYQYSKRLVPMAGFTLIELMVVIVILGLLATIIMPRILDRPEQARRLKAKVQIKNFQSALALFKTDTGRFPTTSQSLEALVKDPGLKGWKQGGYIEGGKVPLDPWGSPYIYLCPGVHGEDYEIESYGKDGEDGGTGDDADIESWNIDQE